MTMPALLALALTVTATWDAWRWYVERISASPEEAISLLVTLLFCITLGFRRQAAERQLTAVPLLTISALLLVYAASTVFAPPIFCAALAFTAIMYGLYISTVGTKPPVAFWGLVALSLPVVPSLQFVLGFPMRIVSAVLTVGMLRMHGLYVERQGTYLVWQGEMVQFDAPCSGVNMLWASLLLTLMTAVLYRWRLRKTALAVIAAVALTIVANALRAASLFYLEAALNGSLVDWWHEGAGLVAFLMAAAALLWTLQKLDRMETGAWPR